MSVDGIDVLYKALEINLDARDFMLSYISALLPCSDWSGITPNKFETSKFILVFQTLPSDKASNYLAQNREVTLRFSIKFSKKLAEDINIIHILKYQTIETRKRRSIT